MMSPPCARMLPLPTAVGRPVDRQVSSLTSARMDRSRQCVSHPRLSVWTVTDQPDVTTMESVSTSQSAKQNLAPLNRAAPSARNLIIAGALAGLVAALLMTLVMAVERDWLGVSPPPEAIPDRFAPDLGISFFFALLGFFGGYNHLKQVGVGSLLMGQLVLGAALGVLYAALVSRHRQPRPFSRLGAIVVATIVGLLWLATLGTLAPVLESNYAGRPPEPATTITVLALLVAYGVFAVTVPIVYRVLLDIPAGAAGTSATPRISRRAILAGSVSALVLAVASGVVLKRLFDRAVFSYDGTEYTGTDLQPIVPNDRFYLVTKNVVDPTVDRSVWRLEVSGLLDRPQSYTFDELAALPATTQETTLMCISNAVGAGLMSNAIWKGVALHTLLDAAGPKPAVTKVVLRGVDGYTDTFPIEKALDPTTLVVYEMNGAPLPERHGFPVRVIVPGMFGEKNVKWVTGIELVDHDVKGFYEKQGWGPNFVIPTRSGFTGPDFSQPLPFGQPVVLKGTAFGGNRGVTRVEVSTDDGRSWTEARRDYPGSQLTWSLWSLEWRPDRPGDYRLVVRAVDGTDGVQTAEERDTAPEGATGYQHVTAHVA